MEYDFQTIVDREQGASYKWFAMHQEYPDLPAHVTPFSMADMEWKNAPEIVEGLKAYLDSYPLGYSMATDNYRRAVCNWMEKRHQWKVQPEWLLPVPGVLPGIFALYQHLSKPGEGIIYLSPVFGWFAGGAALNDRKQVPCPLLFDGESYHIDFSALETAAADPNNKIFVFCNPHNPTSHVWSETDLRRVAEICIKNDLTLISDEIHSDLIMPGFHQISMGTICPDYPKLIVCTAPTKTFNLAGMQVGNMIIRDAVLRTAMEQKFQANGLFVLGSLSYVAGEIAYSKGGPWLDACIAQVWDNHKILKAFVEERLPDIHAFDMEATYLQWMDFRKLVSGADDLKEKLHKAQVILDLGPEFGSEGAGFARMNIACPQSVMLAALERLEAVFYKKTNIERGNNDETQLVH